MKNQLSFDGTWDIETEDWDTFVMGGIHIATENDTTVYHDADSFFEALMELPSGTYWAHNGGRFDSLWLIDMLLKRGLDWTGAMRGSSIIEVRVGSLSFRDSYAVFPEPLSIVAAAGGAKKIDVGLPCRCELTCQWYCSRLGAECLCWHDKAREACAKNKGGFCDCPKTCGGYCNIRQDMTPYQRERVAEYLVEDCRSLQRGLEALANYAARNDIDLRPTIGGSAWNTCAKWLGLDTKKPAHSLSLYHDLRKGYYGGRTEVYGLRADSGNRYDIHNSYPAALSALAMPIGEIRSANASDAFASGRDGVYTARVRIPDCHAPPLPIRTEERLAYCFGEIRGSWTGLELRHAIEYGASVIEIESGIYSSSSAQVLAPYANRVWNLRQEAKKSEPDGIYRWAKWLGNSLTGKLAMAPSVVTLACFDRKLGMRPGEKRVLERYNRLVVAKEVERVGSCAHVEWAGMLTAYARVELHRQLCEAGTDALYCDTDSVYTAGTLTRRVGDDLGEWGHEGTMRDWECLAPKVYRYIDDAKKRYVVRGKGMSRLTPVGFDRLKDGGAWEVNSGVFSLKRAIASGQGVFLKKELSRSLATPGPLVGTRKRAGTKTRAVDFSEYELARA